MKTSDAGIGLIKKYEGRRLDAYQDSVGVWTIGYGHTNAAGPPPVRPGDRISEIEAAEILRKDLKKYEKYVEELVTVPLKQNQFDALVSFCFNVGPGNLKKSTLLRKLNAGNYDEVPREFTKWTLAGGKELPGLVKRRRAEAEMFRGLDQHPAEPEESTARPDAPEPPPVTKDGELLSQIGAAVTTVLTPIAVFITDQKVLGWITAAVALGLIGYAGFRLWERRRDAS